MDKKRALRINLLVIAVILLLVLILFFAAGMTPRRISPNAGVLEGFEPAVTTQAPTEAD